MACWSLKGTLHQKLSQLSNRSSASKMSREITSYIRPMFPVTFGVGQPSFSPPQKGGRFLANSGSRVRTICDTPTPARPFPTLCSHFVFSTHQSVPGGGIDSGLGNNSCPNRVKSTRRITPGAPCLYLSHYPLFYVSITAISTTSLRFGTNLKSVFWQI